MPCAVQRHDFNHITFERGLYSYRGSAHGGGGVRARVSRHARLLGDDKSGRW